MDAREDLLGGVCVGGDGSGTDGCGCAGEAWSVCFGLDCCLLLASSISCLVLLDGGDFVSGDKEIGAGVVSGSTQRRLLPFEGPKPKLKRLI